MAEAPENCSESRGHSGLFVSGPNPDESKTRKGSRKRLGGGLGASMTDDDHANGTKMSECSADTSSPIRPNLAPYHSSFTAAEELVKEVCTDFLQAYQQSYRAYNFSHSAIDHICKELEFYQVPGRKYPSVGAVACLGPAGVGKSSTINAILKQQSSALEHDGGGRGTYVVHVYAGQHKDQLLKYHVVVRFHSMHITKTLASKHDNNIRAYQQLQKNESDDEDVKDVKDKYDTAIDFFMSLLCDCDDFEDQEKAEAYFEEEENDFNETWALIEGQLQQRGYDKGENHFEVANEAELLQIFKQFSRPVSAKASLHGNRAFSPWPIIDKISVHQDLDILNAGVTLADAPGVNDSNLTVVDNTHRCLQTAQAILVFASYKRCVNNTDLDENLRKCIMLGKERETYLVITCIDEKKQLNALEVEDLSEDDRGRLETLKSGIKELDSQIKKDRAAKDNAATLEEMKELHLQEQTRSTQRQAKSDALKQLYVTLSCKDVQAGLQVKLQALSKNAGDTPKLKVFFVSNPQYQKHVQENMEEDRPFLDIEATGIPALSRQLYSIPAIGKLDVLRNICTKRLPSTFRSVGSVLDKTLLERKQEVRQVAELYLRNSDGFYGLVVKTVKTIRRHFIDTIVTTINENEVDWIQQGLKLVDVWAAECKASTFTAFCKRSGIWRLPKIKVRKDWNSLIRAISDDAFISAFNRLSDAIDADERAFSSRLTDCFNGLKDAVDNCDGSHGVPMNSFYDFVDGVADEFADTVHKYFEDLHTRIRVMRAACILDDETIYTARVMHSAYKQCYTLAAPVYPGVPGDGKPRRSKYAKSPLYETRKEILRDCISGGPNGNKSLFVQVGDLAYAELEQFLDDGTLRLTDLTDEWRRRILFDFDHRFKESDAGIKSEDCPEAVAELKAAAQKACDTISGRMAQLLRECEDFEKSGK